MLAGRLGATNVEVGLSHILSGKEKDISKAIRETTLDSLDIMFTGPTVPNPAELLAGERFTSLLETLRARYEYVIIDCSPIMPVIDASIVAKECDGTVFVIAQDRVRKSDAKKALSQLKMSGARVLGTVLNKIRPQGQGYGYGHYGGYGYGYGYGRYGYGYGYGYGHDQEGNDDGRKKKHRSKK